MIRAVKRRIDRLESSRRRHAEGEPEGISFQCVAMRVDAEGRPVVADYETDEVLSVGRVGETKAAFWRRLHPPGTPCGRFDFVSDAMINPDD